MKPLLILRPEPGNEATAVRARALGLDVLQCPLFEVIPVAWTAPRPDDFDALLLTSANAIRHGGPEIGKLKRMKVFGVGPATAAAARDAGFDVACVGNAGVDALLASVPTGQRLLHLAGVDHVRAPASHTIEVVPVYRAHPLTPAVPDCDCVALVQSARAGARLAELVADRRRVSIAAISPSAAAACGSGWTAVESAAMPDERALLALAARLCQD